MSKLYYFKEINLNKFSLVLIVTFIVSVLSILHVIIGYAKSPPGIVYMWTGHYYLDYFQYVQAIAQGMQGKWLLENPLSIEDNSKTFLGMWQNLIFGKVGQFFRLSPIATYWLTVFTLSFLLGLLIFKFIKRLLKDEAFSKQLIAYILTLFAAPFYKVIKDNGKVIVQIYSFWSDKGVLWKRFDSIPYHLTAAILSILVLIWAGDTLEKINTLSARSILFRAIGISLTIIFLLTFSPASALLLVSAIGVYNSFLFFKFLFKKQIKFLGKIILFTSIIVAFVIPAALFIKTTIMSSYYRIAFDFEKGWQVKFGLSQFFLTHGPLSLLAFLGIKNYLQKANHIRLLFLVFVLVSYVLFFSPVPVLLSTTNTRFLSPLSYTLFAVLTILWIKGLKSQIIVVVLLMLFFLPANITAFQNIINDKNIFSPISYLPKGMIGGFKYLNTIPEKGNVMLTPSQFLGCVLPIYTDRKVYVARHNITFKYMEKNITASNFYLGAMTDDQAHEFLEKNGLKFVVLTSIEGYDVKPLYRYPFLKEIYKNKDIVIFKLKPS